MPSVENASLNNTCKRCGTALPESAVFCGVCGSRQNGEGETAATRRHCPFCGTLLSESTKFCGACGTPVSAPGQVPPIPPTQAAPPPVVPPADTSTSQTAGWQPVVQTPVTTPIAPAVKPRGRSRWLVWLLVIVVVLIAITGAVVAWVVQEVKQKASQAEARLAAAARAGQTSRANTAAPGLTIPGLALAEGQRNKSMMDAASVALAIEKNANQSPGQIPANTLPAGTSTISVTPTGGYSWENGSVHYTWDSHGLLVESPGGSQTFAGCTIGYSTPEAEFSKPIAAPANQAADWSLKEQRTEGGPEADLVVRTGDINNLGFGWPQGFDPFSGQSTTSHGYPWKKRASEPQGTDRIMVGSAVGPNDSHNDGYSQTAVCNCPQGWTACQARLDTMPEPVTLTVGALPAQINAVLFQIFVDDFQPKNFGSHFQVSLNGTRIPDFEEAINSLDQTGPIGKLLTLRLLPEYWPLLRSGTVKLLFDDPTTHKGDGYAIDFVRILVNPHGSKYQVSVTATVTDAATNKPIAGATVSSALVSATTDSAGKCELTQLPAGLVVASATASGYDGNSATADLPAGQSGHVDIPLKPHQESAAALEQSINQTGTATIYGIHFDTDSAKLRPDSQAALNAVLGLVNSHSGSKWLIAGHTDSQGSESHNLPLSQARAESVVAWLKDHGADVSRLVPQGFGDERPVADNATENGRALNRRVEVSVVK
jgi:OmpA-OmpF porin, OOP family